MIPIPEDYLKLAHGLRHREGLSWPRITRVLNGVFKMNFQPSSVQAAIARARKKPTK